MKTLALLCLLLFALSGCASPPIRLMAVVRDAMEEARAAEAERYAPREMAVAMESFNAAEKEIAEQGRKFAASRNYRAAMKLYEKAGEEFYLATSRSRRADKSTDSFGMRFAPASGDIEVRVERMESWFRANVKGW